MLLNEVPYIIQGGKHVDQRGQLKYNNDFDLSDVKRIYITENWNMETIRGWQGHRIERRWFTAVDGSFKIDLIKVDNWKRPSKNSKIYSFNLQSDALDVLCVPKGYISKIQSLEEDSKLLVMADYLIGEIEDDYRFTLNYFENYL